MKTRVRLLLIACLWFIAGRTSAQSQNVSLAPVDTAPGYLALLLINETPFPGERGWESEADSKAAMSQILLVLDARLRHIPPRYTQRQVASVESDELIDIMTAKGQVEGFFRDNAGRPSTAPRVTTRVDHLLSIASRGPPGTFARLLNHAQRLADAYVAHSPPSPDLYAALREISGQPVTGRAYSWMTDVGTFHPGGRFVRIPDDDEGGLGGNRFFTLQRLQP
jgi:hypothetical protein